MTDSSQTQAQREDPVSTDPTPDEAQEDPAPAQLDRDESPPHSAGEGDVTAVEEERAEGEVVEEAREELERVVEIIAERHRGPLPPPDVLRQYGEVVDEGAERIFARWETEVDHRRDIQRRTVDAFLAGRTRGQYFAFIIILVLGIGGIVLVALGREIIGLVGFLSALAALAASFLPRLRQDDDDEEDALDQEAEDRPAAPTPPNNYERAAARTRPPRQ